MTAMKRRELRKAPESLDQKESDDDSEYARLAMEEKDMGEVSEEVSAETRRTTRSMQNDTG